MSATLYHPYRLNNPMPAVMDRPTPQVDSLSYYSDQETSAGLWDMEIELGYFGQDGNKNSHAFNSRTALSYQYGRSRSFGEVRLYTAQSDGERSGQRSQLKLQSDYLLLPQSNSYLFGNVDFLEDKFGSYFYNVTAAIGLGFRVIDRDTLKLELEIGPGFRHQEPNLDELSDSDLILPETVDEAIGKGTARLQWDSSANVSITGLLTGVAGDSNQTLEGELSITSNITDSIAVKFSQSLRYQSRVPDGLESRDTTTSFNLLFRL
ncbi:DUF481 domain-containing protein [Vibrio stylophorae]|uniref:DUF481 domain-containing protein n=1 Tax=Vibrio stylophorae TaxID=659351 RepID=UPI001F4035D9|nr:DUF481 domain-containing protein [Vibrio stylophorae]